MNLHRPTLRELVAAAKALGGSGPLTTRIDPRGTAGTLDVTRLADASAMLQRVLRGGVRTSTPAAPVPDAETVPHPGRFLARDYRGRPYKLFIPSSRPTTNVEPAPLVVMLHGCTQSPDDFAAGTRMNQAAEAAGFLVAYPEQLAAANPQRCWNWFKRGDQQRHGAEPSLIAGITRGVMDEHRIDASRVYVAGLSAGAAAAVVMAATYPELYAAIGVHSGLAHGAAHDMQTAFAAMRNGQAGTLRPPGARIVPMIVFHGDRDTTVHPANADAVIAQAKGAATLSERIETGREPGGHGWRRSRHMSPSGETLLEQWTILGAGHAWSGGSPAGSFTDRLGPDATSAMVSFFASHRGAM